MADQVRALLCLDPQGGTPAIVSVSCCRWRDSSAVWQEPCQAPCTHVIPTVALTEYLLLSPFSR